MRLGEWLGLAPRSLLAWGSAAGHGSVLVAPNASCIFSCQQMMKQDIHRLYSPKWGLRSSRLREAMLSRVGLRKQTACHATEILASAALQAVLRVMSPGADWSGAGSHCRPGQAA